MSKSGPIIIVDDDADDRFLIKEVLNDIDVKNPLEFFKDGKEALAYLKKDTPQPFLILCDVNMPALSGIELQKILHEDDALRRKSIPFIFLSTTANYREVNTAYERTVQGFFEKGHEIEKLKKRLLLVVEYWNECQHPNSFAGVAH